MALVCLLTDMMSFGAINKIETKDREGEKIVLLGKQVQSRRKVNVRLEEDCNKPLITACAVMPTGNTVLCDRGNDSLKLFDNSWIYQGGLTIHGIFDISVVDANTVIVTVPHKKKLQYVQILPQLELMRTIHLDFDCWRVCVSREDIYMYVRCMTPDMPREIRVLGRDGTEKRRVPVERNSSPCTITLSPSGEKIFFTDRNTDIVTCMTVDGRIVYKYENDKLKNPRGVYCDLEDNLFVCGSYSNTVHAITADGKGGGTLLTSNDGLDGPCAISYRSSDDELIIGCKWLDNLLVYKMRNCER